MRVRRPLHRAVELTAFLPFLFATASTASATTVGPQVDTTYTGSDSGGQRINVDQTNPLVLDPGTYTAASFTFFAVNPSAATVPFLVINADSLTPNPSADVNSYRVIAVGSTLTTAPLSPNNAPQTLPFGGGAGANFTLAVPTKVFAAVSSGSDNINSIGFIGGGTVDHDNSTSFTPTVGATTPTFSNPNLGRTYGFNVDVLPIPEPAGAAVAVLALVGAHRLRRCRPA